MAEFLRQQNRLKQTSDQFPTLCSNCLGQNTLLKMHRSVADAECIMCYRVYTLYKWRRGGDKKMLQTRVCPFCSHLKNICQCCLLDLQFKVPTYIRDSMLAREGYDEAIRTKESRQMALYTSEVEAKKLEQEGGTAGMDTRARGLGMTDSLTKMIDEGGNPYDTRPKLYKEEEKAMKKTIRPPVDRTVKTVFVGGLILSGHRVIGEDILLKHFRPYGLIKRIKINKKLKCALITFHNREDAEICVEALYNRLVINEKPLKIMWAKRKSSSSSSSSTTTTDPSKGETKSMKLDPVMSENQQVLPKNAEEMMAKLPDGIEYILPPHLFDNIPPPPSENDSFEYQSLKMIESKNFQL